MDLGIVSEVMAGGKICMHAPVFAGFRNLILANIDGRTDSQYKGTKDVGGFIRQTVAEDGSAKMVRDLVGDAEWMDYCGRLKPEDRVVNLVRLNGPMTRGGAACSYGSMEIRDQIMSSADIPQCKAHIILCNTPGGMASCIQDLRMAVNYAHDHGQKVFMLIDGMCASGGTFASALCDGVYCVNLEDEIGSIGMYCSFFTLADGAENKITSEVYHEYYATASKDKNAWYRAAAEGDMKLIEKETNADLAQMIANIKKDRPSIKDEQCTGAMYKMKDVIGSLIDGQTTLPQLAALALGEWDERQGAAVERKETADNVSAPEPEPEPAPAPEPEEPEVPEGDGDDDENHDGEADGNEGAPQTSTEPKNNNPMTKQYTAIPAAIGEEAMESLDGELTLSPEQAEALEARLAQEDTRVADLTQQLAEATTAHETAIAELNTQHENAVAELNQQHADGISEVNAAHEAAVAEINTAHATELESLRTQHAAEIESLNTAHAAELEGLNTQLAELRTQMEQLTQQRNDLQATVEELNNAAGAQPQAGEQPAGNGKQAPAQPRIVTSSTYDPRLSAEENYRLQMAARGK